MEEDTPECTTKASEACVSRATSSSNNVHLMSYSFNQNASCWVCGTTAGFRVFNTDPIAELRRRERLPAFEDRSIVVVSMLMRTTIYAMVTLGRGAAAHEPANKVQIWDEKQARFVGELRSKYEVKGVALRADIIALVCEGYVRVYTCDKLQPILEFKTTANPHGLCTIALASKPWILCSLGSEVGKVRLQLGRDEFLDFQAHERAVAAIALNEAGTRLATASEYGTVVKVWRCEGAQLCHRLRVAMSSESISCISFRPSGDCVAVASSSTPFIHLFRLEPQEETSTDEVAQEKQQGSGDGVWSLTKQLVKSFVPECITDTTSFARFQIPGVDSRGRPELDLRGEGARISGPQVAFHRTEPLITVLHYSGMVYEANFKDALELAGHGAQACALASTAMWFAVRPEFKLVADKGQPDAPPVVRVSSSELEGKGLAGDVGGIGGGDEDDAWEVL